MNAIFVNRHNYPVVLLFFLTVTAVYFRSSELGPPSLWTDDAWVALAIRQDLVEIWQNSITSIGFKLITGTMLGLFGNESRVAQFFPFVFGILTIPMTYLVARQLKLAPLFALFAAGLVASSPTLVTYSTRVKQYTGDAFITLLMASLLLYLFSKPCRTTHWIAFGLFCCVAIVFSGQLMISAACALFLAVVYTWQKRKNEFRTVLAVSIIIGLFILLWYFLIIEPNMHEWLLEFWSRGYVVVNQGIPEAVISFVNLMGEVYENGIGDNFFLVITCTFLTILALRLKTVISLAILLPVLAAIILSILGKAPIGDRPDAYFVPLLILSVGLGLQSVLEYFRRSGNATMQKTGTWACGILMVALLTWELPDRFLPEEYPAHNIRTATGIWDEYKQPGDHILIHCTSINAFRLYSSIPVEVISKDKYRQEANSGAVTVTLLAWYLGSHPDQYYDVITDNVPVDVERLWLMAAPEGKNPDQSFLKRAILSAGFEKEREWDTDGSAELVLYLRK